MYYGLPSMILGEDETAAEGWLLGETEYPDDNSLALTDLEAIDLPDPYGDWEPIVDWIDCGLSLDLKIGARSSILDEWNVDRIAACNSNKFSISMHYCWMNWAIHLPSKTGQDWSAQPR